MAKKQKPEEYEIQGMLGMDLGYIEEDYVRQQQAVSALACDPRIYPDLPLADAGWSVVLTRTSPRQAVIEACRKTIDTGLPVICWGTDQLDELSGGLWGTRYGYLFAIWTHSADPLRQAFAESSILEEYFGHVRVREVVERPFVWSLQFAANLNPEPHRQVIASLRGQAEQRLRAFS